MTFLSPRLRNRLVVSPFCHLLPPVFPALRGPPPHAKETAKKPARAQRRVVDSSSAVRRRGVVATLNPAARRLATGGTRSADPIGALVGRLPGPPTRARRPVSSRVPRGAVDLLTRTWASKAGALRAGVGSADWTRGQRQRMHVCPCPHASTPCLVPKKFCKIFQIPRHIESLDVCMEY